MAAFHGKAGYVTFDTGATANVTSWALDATADVADSTVMSAVAIAASTHWKDYTPGFKAWTATVECILDSGGFDPNISTDFGDEDGAALVLYEGIQAQGVRKYSGTAYITGVTPVTDKEDVARCTYAFQGSSTLSVAASDYVP